MHSINMRTKRNLEKRILSQKSALEGCLVSQPQHRTPISVWRRFRLRVISLILFPVDRPKTAESLSELFRYTVYAMYSTQYPQLSFVSCFSVHVKICVHKHKLLKLRKEKKRKEKASPADPMQVCD
jgi:hypothetical protein